MNRLKASLASSLRPLLAGFGLTRAERPGPPTHHVLRTDQQLAAHFGQYGVH